MKAYLHLCNNQTDDSIMWQVLNEDFEIDEGDTFTYSERFFNALDRENKKIFEKGNLKIGNYKVHSTWKEENSYWGDLRIIYLRPE